MLQKGARTVAFEIKASSTPSVQKGFWNAVEDLQPDEVCIVGPVRESYPLANDVMVRTLEDAVNVIDR